MSLGDLHIAAADLLDVAEGLLAQTPSGAPERVYVSPGTPAREGCEFLTVHVAAIGEEVTSPTSPPPASGHRQIFQRINLPAYVVTIQRCVATTDQRGNPVAGEILDAVAETTLGDAWILWNGLMTAVREERLFASCREVHFDAAVALPIQGGYGGWTLGVRALLPGYPVSVGT